MLLGRVNFTGASRIDLTSLPSLIPRKKRQMSRKEEPGFQTSRSATPLSAEKLPGRRSGKYHPAKNRQLL